MPATNQFGIQRFSRRAMLRGAGVALALPWLESRSAFGTPANSAGRSGASPRRFAVLFMGNGINQKHWWAKGNGAAMVLGRSLEPMAPLKTKMTLINGLFNKASIDAGIHPGQTGNLLSGVRLQKGAELKGGISVDQVLANHIGEQTAQASLVLGCEQPTTGYHESNYSLAYSSHISWANETSPVPMEQYPSLAFDSLVENRGSQRMKSVLDRVLQQANDLSQQVSVSDKAKLDEYLTSVREVEARIERSRAAKEKSDQAAHGKAATAIPMHRPANGFPEDIREHMKLMCDIVALAFQTDRSRVATLLLCRDLSGHTYPFMNIRIAHHFASHSDWNDDYEKISRFYCSQFAYLASRLDAMKEGENTVLDNSCLMFTSNMWSGSSHDSQKVPVLLAGSLGGTLKTGRALDYSFVGDENRKLCSLYLSVMDRMGVNLPRFGDAETRLANLD